VTHDDDPIGRKVYVELEPVGTGGEPTLERGHGVLGAKCATASMRKDSGF
jgi:hypothetical protein